MTISTRSVTIAHGGGCVVDFGALDPVGPVFVAIFMTYSGMSCVERGTNVSKSMKILKWCAVLAIALYVTGCAVSYLVTEVGSFEQACAFYMKDSEARRVGECHETGAGQA